MVKRILLPIILSFFLLSLSVHNTVTVHAETPAAFTADQINRIDLNDADLQFIPLFGSREEDNQSIEEIVKIVNSIVKNGEPTTDAIDSWQRFFMSELVIKFNDYTSLSVTLPDTETIYYTYLDKKYKTKDKTAVVALGKLFVSPVQTAVGGQVQIGGTYNLKGEDAYSERGTVFLFIKEIGSSGGYESAKGVHYPSKNALLVHRAPSAFARYDFSYTFPAFGEAADGTWKAIEPGTYDLTIVRDGLTSSHFIKVAAPKEPQLSVNGFPVSETAVKPIIIDGRTYLPARSLAEMFGWDVVWDENQRLVRINTDYWAPASASADGPIRLWVNGKQVSSNTAPVLIENKLHLPLRTVAEAFGFTVKWIASTKSVHAIFEPELLAVYQQDDQTAVFAEAINKYATAFNERNEPELKKLFESETEVFPRFEDIGRRLITSVSNLQSEPRREGKAVAATVDFHFLFDNDGNSQGSRGFVFVQEDGRWVIRDIE
ncbi:stalk domain-containing protein [Paenibacillus alkalitolerans]|uniref:stalk domain-containing protein n=1 Tax=Paenibacillus alkalitolerans TaxID=2799335 RepID=UPI0018F45B70|nr:stalk domain-containing protein [Paenibacillus alkalitolerans]